MSACKLAIDFISNNTIDVTIKCDKVENAKVGIKAWQLFRKYCIKNYEDLNVNGHVKTSMAALEWKRLSKDEKKKWSGAVLNPDVCGNRWVNYM